VCDDCPECDTAADIRKVMELVPQPAADHRTRRLSYLRSQGIAEADLDDADRALVELRGDCCACKRRKSRNHSLCPGCFRMLPSDLQRNLWLHMRHGYLTHIRQAWELLRRAGRIA
jgi:hypothetical protein